MGDKYNGEFQSKNMTAVILPCPDRGTSFLADKSFLSPLEGHCLLFYHLPCPVLLEGGLKGNKDDKIQSLIHLSGGTHIRLPKSSNCSTGRFSKCVGA